MSISFSPSFFFFSSHNHSPFIIFSFWSCVFLILSLSSFFSDTFTKASPCPLTLRFSRTSRRILDSLFIYLPFYPLHVVVKLSPTLSHPFSRLLFIGKTSFEMSLLDVQFISTRLIVVFLHYYLISIHSHIRKRLVSISSTFYAHIFCQYFGAKKFQSRT